VKVSDKATVAGSDQVASAVAQAEAELGDSGRILLRPSGTEQLIRVMVEATTQDHADQIAHRVADVVRSV
jgi:phosphoglucosamine mutase